MKPSPCAIRWDFPIFNIVYVVYESVQKVLWPDFPISHVQLSEDELGRHYGAFLPDTPEPVAVISVFAEPVPVGEQGPDDTSAARFRKFACRPDLQGRGIGTLLLQHVIRAACVDTLWCDARLATADWYQKRGLVAFGPVFLKSGVEYVRMKIGLSSS
jgi:GNAT superfamily N-acetyltransferase